MIVVEPVVSEEKLREALAEGSDSPALDYKRRLHLSSAKGAVEFAKDVAGLQGEASGGYLLLGADDRGQVTGDLDAVATALLDETVLRDKIKKYFPYPPLLQVGVHQIDGHKCALVYVAPAPEGFTVMAANGAYEDPPGTARLPFRKGDVFVRQGTSTQRWSQADAADRLARFAQKAKDRWRKDLALDLEHLNIGAPAVSPSTARTLGWELDGTSFDGLILEALRTDDDISLKALLLQLPGRVEAALSDGRWDDVATLLDRAVSLGALVLTYERRRWLPTLIKSLLRVYSLAGRPNLLTSEASKARLWLLIVERVYALGALATRLREWSAVSELAVAKPTGSDFDYFHSWLRHASVAAARTGQTGGSTPEEEAEHQILARAHNVIRTVDALHPDVPADADDVTTSLCRFDALAAVAVVSVSGDPTGRSFYPHFSRYYPNRTIPALEAVIQDPKVRAGVFPSADETLLARALAELLRLAQSEGMRFTWWGADSRVVAEFLREHLDRPPL